MFDDDPNDESFEETLRSIVREVSESLERVAQLSLDDIAGVIGVDPARVQGLIDSAVGWLRAHAEGFGESGVASGAEPRGPAIVEDSMRSSGPQPLDVPTRDQGVALAALDSGRWRVEPGSHALIAQGEGPGPGDAPGLVDELRARDWIAADGEVTLVGRRALSRWLDAADGR
jgi:hypothetical protein